MVTPLVVTTRVLTLQCLLLLITSTTKRKPTILNLIYFLARRFGA